ncbi:MAG TPA: hypothetical protein VM938_01340 [Acidimicrobiales bacterium]|nr:hypothetical protein [Acidimicrobiales bacterium]
MSTDDSTERDELDVEPEELKDLDPVDGGDDVKGGGGNTSGRCM